MSSRVCLGRPENSAEFAARGALSIPGNGFAAIYRQGALAATNPADLPAPLQGPLVRDFPVGSGAAYTLEWTRQDLDRFIELRPSANYDQHVAVIARLGGGYRLVCLFPTARSGPTCGTY